ncbi:hypothetical protein NLU13_3665 [Sarocladium strictum]|uniref:5'-nucleotidase n=1 Tax=Sarocladium strictum TaxID=5046 RepID=A0AA39LAG6_SARSR|nr:hypothetical protein NLU13_3665 [Sarocladium strictum]
MARGEVPPSGPSVTFASGRLDGAPSEPDLRIVHFNDVYHVDPSSSEPVGGLPRFITLCREYRDGEQYAGQSKLLTLFSGDAFNPSLESSVTKGKHMVPALNEIGTDVACLGNHDLDFGVRQFEYLAGKCNFPWLLANVLDPALGEDVPLGNAKKTHMLTTSNGIKVGLIGLGEREWLATINSLPPNLIYKSATATAKELVPKLRAEGAEIIICLSHQREPNDNKLAAQTEGMIDIILGGHDHYYGHSFINGTHVLRSGSDFKQLSYIEVRRKEGGWDFDIWRRDTTSDIPEHVETIALVNKLTSKLQHTLAKAIGWTATGLDARFSTVRMKESNIGNFVCDVMRQHYAADCTIMAAGTIRGDEVYPPGAITVKTIVNCFPFEDPCILIKVPGQAIWDALENGVSQYPAQEGRFPQVSNICFEFDPQRKAGQRVLSLQIGGEVYDPDRKYLLCTRGYMGRAKDGFDSLLVESEGGKAEEIVDEESGMLISAILRQYFQALQTIGQWKHLSDHWKHVAEKVETPLIESPLSPTTFWEEGFSGGAPRRHLARHAISEETSESWRAFMHKRFGLNLKPVDGLDGEESSDEDESVEEQHHHQEEQHQIQFEVLLMRKFGARWMRKAGVKSECASMNESEFAVDWTRTIAPIVEGRIKIVGS